MRRAHDDSRVHSTTFAVARVAADSRMFELKDAVGKPLFEQIAISLVCEVCMKTDTPEKCATRVCLEPSVAFLRK